MYCFLMKYFSMMWNYSRLWYKPRHLNNIRKSKKVIKKIVDISKYPHGLQKGLSYLRKVSPQVYEEIALTVFENNGFIVLRNTKYTDDGGVDGFVRIPGYGFVPVQSKRYSAHISAEHVRDFDILIKKRNNKIGFFIHTGKTGQMSKDIAKTRIVFLSGLEYVSCIANIANFLDFLEKK